MLQNILHIKKGILYRIPFFICNNNTIYLPILDVASPVPVA